MKIAAILISTMEPEKKHLKKIMPHNSNKNNRKHQLYVAPYKPSALCVHHPQASGQRCTNHQEPGWRG